MKNLNKVTLNTILAFLKPFSTKKQLREVANLYNCCGSTLTYELSSTDMQSVSFTIGCDIYRLYFVSTEDGSTLEEILEILNRVFYFAGTFTGEGNTVTLKLNKTFEDSVLKSSGCVDLNFTVYED